MKKTSDEELNYWRTQYPSSFVSWKFEGDEVYAQTFIGNAELLLYKVKNFMRLSDLKQWSLTEPYADGTVIEAKSVFGQDFITINVTKALFPFCTITFLDLPKVVPPMKWYDPDAEITETFTKVDDEWVIRKPNGDLEIEGNAGNAWGANLNPPRAVDYIKTYYMYGVSNCPGCSQVQLTVAKGEDSYILTGSSPNRPFWYKAEDYQKDGVTIKDLIYTYDGKMVPHFMGYDWATPPVPPDPMNHTIYSLWKCQAEIFKFDVDKGGSYFLWKAYTEWSNEGPQVVDFSRTGLGYMLMQGFIKNMGRNLCQSKGTIIKVDCCVKPEAERQVKLWWESKDSTEVGGPTCSGQPFMFYGDMKICEVPTEVFGLYSLICVSWMGYHSKTFMAIPEINGSCVPLTWEVSGGDYIIVPTKPNGEMAALTIEKCPDANDPILCKQVVVVTVKDRCGSEDTVTFLPCCTQREREGNSAVSVSYTSLTMGCSSKQTLYASGGCGPYTWSCTGTGSINVLDSSGWEVEYTAPANNAGCLNNDSVTVTDCCGHSGSVTFYVTCNPAGNAYMITRYVNTGRDAGCGTGGEAGLPRTRLWVYGDYYDCYGAFLSSYVISEVCLCSDDVPPCPPHCTKGAGTNCEAGVCGWQSVYQCDGYVTDVRIASMKANGCCPINPATGLPFSWD